MAETDVTPFVYATDLPVYAFVNGMQNSPNEGMLIVPRGMTACYGYDDLSWFDRNPETRDHSPLEWRYRYEVGDILGYCLAYRTWNKTHNAYFYSLIPTTNGDVPVFFKVYDCLRYAADMHHQGVKPPQGADLLCDVRVRIRT